MLIGDWWICPEGAFEMNSSEHAAFAIAYILGMPKDKRVPNYWTIRGIPSEEIDAALKRGADPEAVEFIANKRNDARLWAMREYGWIRTAKNAWNLWYFDDETADIVRDNEGYWEFQAKTGKMSEYEMIDIYEFKDGCEYAISVQKLLDGGKPQVLKKLATGGIACAGPEAVAPHYSTSKYGELERQKLYGRTGANPRKRKR